MDATTFLFILAGESLGRLLSVCIPCFCAELSFKGVHKKFFLVMLVSIATPPTYLHFLFLLYREVVDGVMGRQNTWSEKRFCSVLPGYMYTQFNYFA